MNTKTLATINYITIFGWLYVYLTAKEKDAFLKYHLRQSLGLFVAGLLVGFAIGIVAAFIPTLALLSMAIGILNLMLMIIGAINASNGVEKPLPIIGKIFEDKFSFVG